MIMQFGNSAKRILGIIMYEIFRILLHKIVTINNEKQTILLPLCYFAVIKFYFRWYLNAVYYQLTELFPKGNLFEPCSLLKFKKKHRTGT